jgi:hypothetical protein
MDEGDGMTEHDQGSPGRDAERRELTPKSVSGAVCVGILRA